jgi:cytochrome c peroxidase
MFKFKFAFFILLAVIGLLSMRFTHTLSSYYSLYNNQLTEFQTEQQKLIKSIENKNDTSQLNIVALKKQIAGARIKLKAIDFWLRYLEPVAYKKINGPLPVEWETEVFEKFEKPYKRPGAGLTLAELYLDEPNPEKNVLLSLLQQSDEAIKTFQADSITGSLTKPGHFFFANRLFLLNLSAIYTTGFECPDPDNIVGELQAMLGSVKTIYQVFNKSFPANALTGDYFQLYNKMEAFVASQARDKDYGQFDHFHFLRDYVNPLYIINQRLINTYHFFSRNYNDYSLNDNTNSIFDKNLYHGQNSKGIFIAVNDPQKLNEIKAVGKMLFFDPILSGNGKRSCASCHKPNEYFTDTTVATGLSFNETGRLPRNTPTLLNAVYNHLLMLDGKHISLQNQAKDVITNSNEMGCDASKILVNVMSCDEYKKAFQKLLKLTPYYDEVNIDHVVSSITLYYSGFSDFNAPFDNAMNRKEIISNEAIRGFNLFMSKAQCATCHFVPQFNGVKPPYISSEFEVIGVPSDIRFKKLSNDSGRYKMNPAIETMHAFRTGSIRNSTYTKPYMHNGVFTTMDEVIDFYDAGGGVGKGLKLDNQTLSSDSLRLTKEEKNALKTFIKTLDENISFQKPPVKLPATKLETYKARKIGGEY